MGVIEATRALGAEIQKDERFIRYAKAKLANDNDAQLQNQIGEFNTIRMNLDREMNAENQDEAKIRELNENFDKYLNCCSQILYFHHSLLNYKLILQP